MQKDELERVIELAARIIGQEVDGFATPENRIAITLGVLQRRLLPLLQAGQAMRATGLCYKAEYDAAIEAAGKE